MASTQRERRGLFSGLLFLYVGIVFLLVKMGLITGGWSFLGKYWPLLLILAGMAKTIEYFFYGSGKLFRGGEIFLILLIVIAGVSIHVSAPILESLPGIIDWDHNHLSLGAIYKDSFHFQEEKDFPLAPGSSLKIQNEKGGVILVPIAQGSPRMRINKEVYAENEQEAKPLAERTQVTIEQMGDQTVITVNQPADVRSLLEITIPSRCSLQVETAYGEISAEGFQGGQHSFRNRHGKISLVGLVGNVTVNNEYGLISVEKITGPVQCTNVHGEITAREITGNLTASNAYSAVKVLDIKGDINITNSHNSVEVIQVVGKVEITAPQSRVVVEDVQGPVRLESSQREVRLTRIASPVDLRQKYGKVSLERIGSEVKANLEHTEWNSFDLQGPVRVEGIYSHIRMEKTAGDIDIRNSMRSVSLEGFSSRVQVENENGSVTLFSSQAIRQPIQVRTTRGRIELYQPENSPFRLAAHTQSGRIHSDFPQLMAAFSERDQKALSGEIGTGGPLITLESVQGGIWIKRNTDRRPPPDQED